MRVALRGHKREVIYAAYSPDGTRAVTCSGDSTAEVWDTTSGAPVTPPLVHAGTIQKARFSPDGTRVVTASWDSTARVWDARTGQPVTPPLRSVNPVMDAAISPDGRWVASTRIWNIASGQPSSPPFEQHQSIHTVCFSPDGQRVLTSSEDRTALISDLKTGLSVTPPLLHAALVIYAIFDPSGQRVATASFDHSAQVWDTLTGQPIGAPLSHDDAVLSVCFSPDSRRLLTTSTDKTAKIWDLAPVSPPPPWLCDLLEAMGGSSLDDIGQLHPLPVAAIFKIEDACRKSKGNDPWEIFGRWLLSDPRTRTISPWSSVTVPDYVQRLISQGTNESLDEAEKLSYGEPEVQAQIAAKRAALPPVRASGA
jgi:hypothetical protein